MNSVTELLREIARYEWMLEKVEAYQTDYGSRDAERTLSIIRDCIRRKHQEICGIAAYPCGPEQRKQSTTGRRNSGQRCRRA